MEGTTIPNENKISHRWRERAWRGRRGWSHGKLGRTPASDWLHRMLDFLRDTTPGESPAGTRGVLQQLKSILRD